MRILVDHGCKNNFGDFGMLKSVCAAYGRRSGISCTLLDREGFASELYDGENILESGEKLVPRAASVERVKRLPGYSAIPLAISNRVEGRLRNRDLRRMGAEAFEISPGGKALIDFCDKFDAFHLAGGGYLNDAFPRAVLEKCAIVNAFHRIEKPVILTGQQFGPFHKRYLRSICQQAIRCSDFVGVREPGNSMAFCKDAGLLNHVLMGDDVFGLPLPQSTKIQAVLQSYGLLPGEYIAINYRISDYSPQKERYLNHFIDVLKAIKYATSKPMIFVPITISEGDSDLATAKLLADMLEDPDISILHEEHCVLETITGILGSAMLSLGSSYHFCTFSLMQGVPAMATVAGGYYSQKAKGLAELWQVPEIYFSLISNDIHDAGNALSRLCSGSTKTQLKTRAIECCELWQSSMDEALDTALSPHVHS